VKFVTGVACGVAVVAVATACGGSSSPSKSPGDTTPAQHPASLVGIVGHNDSFSISLTDPSGAEIKNLAAGTYSLTVKDESSIHNFHLSGAGADHKTSVGGTGTSTFSVTFKPGKYTFVCDPHSSSMRGEFRVS
jgi:plastocyanin